MNLRRILMREITQSRRQAAVFCLCVALSLTSLTAFSGFSESVYLSLMADARKLHAADIVVHAHGPLTDELNSAVSVEVQQGRVLRSRYYEFYSVVRTFDERASVLSHVKVVEPEYPFYGEVVLRSGRRFHDVLTAGQAVVEQTLLDRLGAGIGDTLRVGYQTLIIRDVVVAEPDRPVNVFSFGPRVFVSTRDLNALGLLQTGSRITYQTLLKVFDERQTDEIAARLGRAAHVDRERVDTYRTAGTRIKRFLDNFIFFLKLVGIFILIIAGIGIQNTLTAFFYEKQQAIAVMKTVGATNRHILRHYVPVVVSLGLVGTILGLASGQILQLVLMNLLSAFIPSRLTFVIAWPAAAEGLGLGFVVVALFTFLPLYRLSETRPVATLRKETATLRKRWPLYVSGLGFTLFIFGLVLRHMQDLRFGIYFVTVLVGAIFIASLLTRLLLWMLQGLRVRHILIRQAVRGLFRRGGATQTIMVTLTVSLSIIFSIYLVEQNLDATYVRSYPADAPNLFFIDIQPDQREEFRKLADRPLTFYPVVRARVAAINDKPIDRRRERAKRRDNLARAFNLTYRQTLLPDERVVKGGGLFRKDWQEPQVSIMDTVVDMHAMDIGDTIRFNIQGVPLTARIASIRSRIADSLKPFFYFVLEEKVLASAPQTVFTALRVEKDQVGLLQNRIVNKFPNISVIDVSATLQTFGRLMKQLSSIVRGFSILSMAAGMMILVSAVFATRAERLIESVYYKILGARKSFVRSVFALEIFFLGLFSALLALIVSQASVFFICRYFLNIVYQPFVLSCAVIATAVLIMITGIGLLATRSILEKRPVVYLREQPDA